MAASRSSAASSRDCCSATWAGETWRTCEPAGRTAAVPDVIGADGRITIGTRSFSVGVFPIGIDAAAIEAQATEASQSEAVRRMTASLLGRRLMIGVDRLDYSKGLVERFAAYQSFLESYPANLGKITFMQIAPLSRTDVWPLASMAAMSSAMNASSASSAVTGPRPAVRDRAIGIASSSARLRVTGAVTARSAGRGPRARRKVDVRARTGRLSHPRAE